MQPRRDRPKYIRVDPIRPRRITRSFTRSTRRSKFTTTPIEGWGPVEDRDLARAPGLDPDAEAGREDQPRGLPDPQVDGEDARGGTSESQSKLKGSIGEGSNHSNYSDQSSVRILSKFRIFH